MSFLHSRKLVVNAMLLRPHHRRLQRRIHSDIIDKLVRMTQKPLPLTYKLHPIELPISLEKPNQQPLTPVESLPFSIERTNSGNLPVYVKYRNEHQIKRTIIRKISGDVQKMAEELSKVVSNAEIRIKVGKIQIPGVHKESVETWLLRLGY